MLMAKRFGKVHSYEEWCEPKIVSNTLTILEKEIPKYKNDIKSVHLSFTTDPFMYGYDDIRDLSIEILSRLNAAGIKCTTLTKGVLPIEIAKLSKENEYGITLVSLDEAYRAEAEPGSAPYAERIASLKALHDAGMKTWVSIEPYPTPNILEQEFAPILDVLSFVDKIIFGRLNYNKEVSAYKNHKQFFNVLAAQTIKFCEEHGIEYHIKSRTITTEKPAAIFVPTKKVAVG
jgi:DNA repair photolyase